MRRFRHLWISLFLICFSLLGFVGRVEATDGLRGDECIVTEDEIILQDFYFFCNTLVVYGYISGDIVGIASEVTIAREGHVTGDIWIVGGQLTIEGVVGDDIHFVGADLDVTGLARFSQQGSDIIAAGISLQIDERVVIPGDVIYYGYQAILEGAINGNIYFQGQSLLIQNNVAGSVNAIVGDQEGNAPLSSLPLLYSVDFRKPGLYFSTSSDDERQGYVNGDLTY
ncbi:MAG TPA: polymer-forming cytoskeletal protein, partial [Aggregatilineales bacterium]|nr:polymer-forming cytoskeletal protein [Aggregatilineales bacterium]